MDIFDSFKSSRKVKFNTEALRFLKSKGAVSDGNEWTIYYRRKTDSKLKVPAILVSPHSESYFNIASNKELIKAFVSGGDKAFVSSGERKVSISPAGDLCFKLTRSGFDLLVDNSNHSLLDESSSSSEEEESVTRNPTPAHVTRKPTPGHAAMKSTPVPVVVDPTKLQRDFELARRASGGSRFSTLDQYQNYITKQAYAVYDQRKRPVRSQAATAFNSSEEESSSEDSS